MCHLWEDQGKQYGNLTQQWAKLSKKTRWLKPQMSIWAPLLTCHLCCIIIPCSLWFFMFNSRGYKIIITCMSCYASLLYISKTQRCILEIYINFFPGTLGKFIVKYLYAGTSKLQPFVLILLLYQSIFLHINNLILNIFLEIIWRLETVCGRKN